TRWLSCWNTTTFIAPRKTASTPASAFSRCLRSESTSTCATWSTRTSASVSSASTTWGASSAMDEFRGFEFERPILDLEAHIREIQSLSSASKVMNLDEEVQALEEKRDRLLKEIFSALTPWQKVQLARHPKRPYTLDYIQALFTDF